MHYCAVTAPHVSIDLCLGWLTFLQDSCLCLLATWKAWATFAACQLTLSLSVSITPSLSHYLALLLLSPPLDQRAVISRQWKGRGERWKIDPSLKHITFSWEEKNTEWSFNEGVGLQWRLQYTYHGDYTASYNTESCPLDRVTPGNVHDILKISVWNLNIVNIII